MTTSSGSHATSMEAHNRLNILHLISFKPAIVFTFVVVKKEESFFQRMCLWLGDNRRKPRVSKKWHFCFLIQHQESQNPESGVRPCSPRPAPDVGIAKTEWDMRRWQCSEWLEDLPSFWEMSLRFVITLEWLSNQDTVNGEKHERSSFPNAGRKQVR